MLISSWRDREFEIRHSMARSLMQLTYLSLYIGLNKLIAIATDTEQPFRYLHRSYTRIVLHNNFAFYIKAINIQQPCITHVWSFIINIPGEIIKSLAYINVADVCSYAHEQKQTSIEFIEIADFRMLKWRAYMVFAWENWASVLLLGI